MSSSLRMIRSTWHRIAILLTALAPISAGCGKKADVTGKVINFETGKPVEGVAIVLTEFHGVRLGWTGAGKSKRLARVLTDADGAFLIDYRFKGGATYEYDVRIDQVDRFMEPDTGDIEEFYFARSPFENIEGVRSRHSEVTFEVVPTGRVKVVLRDVAPFGDVSAVSVVTGDSLGPTSEDVFSNFNGEVARYHRVRTNGSVRLVIRRYQSGYYFEEKRQVSLAPFSKKMIEIEI